ncbi:hypothetical protein ACFV06_01095 [Streptomyces sp. NPDC059618]|uniref:hypothetical protein n=1 Tax=Streptomyces sp. NPDC059618 TaxID=3346887 RepID=UPI0036AD05B7
MPPTRPHPQAGHPPATPTPPHPAPAGAAPYADSAPAPAGAVSYADPAPAPGRVVSYADSAPAPAGAGEYAARLEVLLGDPRDPRNPYGRAALGAAGPGVLPVPPAFLPGIGDLPDAGQLARALRPLFRRDLALAHAWSIRPLLTAEVPHPAAVLLGPAALLAGAGTVLLAAARIVEGLSRHQAAARQWRPVLATVFADLLACESLTATALRSCPPPPRRPGQDAELLAAVTGYLVPQLALELLGDLELVLNECGFGPRTVERRTLARLVRDRAFAGADPAATAAAQARIVRGLGTAAAEEPDPGTGLAALFHDTGTALVTAAAPDTSTSTDAGTGTGSGGDVLRDAAAPGADDTGSDALVRLGRRLAAERRALRTACAAVVVYDPADPAARALADRRALLVLAAGTTAVQEAAASARLPFLGDTGWTRAVLARITVRLGLPLPTAPADPLPGLWQELARRAADGVDCDLHATRPA